MPWSGGLRIMHRLLSFYNAVARKKNHRRIIKSPYNTDDNDAICYNYQ